MNRSGPGAILRLYCFPLLLVAAILTLLVGRRFPIQDRACVVVILAIAALFYLRDRRLIMVALTFAGLSWWMEATPPGWAAGPLRTLAALRVPPPRREARPLSFDEVLAQQAAERRFEEESQFLGYVVLNGVAYLVLLLAAIWMRRRSPGVSDPAEVD